MVVVAVVGGGWWWWVVVGGGGWWAVLSIKTILKSIKIHLNINSKSFNLNSNALPVHMPIQVPIIYCINAYVNVFC